ncbi:TRAP transporter small permease subunit [Aliikangiella marina]|uniref:TRAP transporter small permease protein n=1 Tax=Aliikangiella marina TaxID=1712262 RepID=A0A545T4U8_9GAMM|nr:TRAP transporter small permease subunit [Aliikangiella marina]TQV72215.1 TRAP transporter small permease subunit [Aliikangiella marina]
MKYSFNLLADHLSKVSVFTGRLVSWLTIGMVVILSFNVISSWLFNVSAILLTESVTWMHSANFLLAAAYTLNRGEHVRVDIFYAKMTAKRKALVDLLGTLFLLLPVCAFILWSSWSFVLLSWNIGEVSAEAGGLPFLWILKGFLIVMPVLLIIEGIAQFFKNLSVLMNDQSTTGQAEKSL